MNAREHAEGLPRRTVAMLATGVTTAGVMFPVAADAATTWSSPLALAVVSGFPSPALVTAGQASGTAVVAWTSSGQVTVSVRTPAAKWSAATAVSPKGETATSPAMVVRPDGSVVAAWAALRSADQVIESAVWTPAGGWSPAALVSSGGLSSAGPVQMAVGGTGGASAVLAAWGQRDASGTVSVSSAALPAAGSWSAPDILATPSASLIRQVSVAVNSAGAAVIGWIRKNNDLFGDVITRPSGGSFGTPVTIAAGPWRPALQQLHSLSVAIDAAGRASAAWNNSCANASAQQANGTWAPATVFPQAYASNPALGIDSTGTAQVLWAVGSAQASSLPAGGTWAPASSVFPGSAPIDLGIANDFAAWWDTSAKQINAAVHTSSGWSTPVKVNPPLSGTPWIAAVSISPVGSGALIAWISGTGSQGTVQVSLGS